MTKTLLFALGLIDVRLLLYLASTQVASQVAVYGFVPQQFPTLALALFHARGFGLELVNELGDFGLVLRTVENVHGVAF
jgi:hypothetical protein